MDKYDKKILKKYAFFHVFHYKHSSTIVVYVVMSYVHTLTGL